jgi:hypothetical protein
MDGIVPFPPHVPSFLGNAGGTIEAIMRGAQAAHRVNGLALVTRELLMRHMHCGLRTPPAFNAGCAPPIAGVNSRALCLP